MTTRGYKCNTRAQPRWVCWIRSSVFVGLMVVTHRQADHATCVATGRIFTLCIAMRAKNYNERQYWRHQFRGQHEWNKARCKRVVVTVGNCTRAMCVRARRCQCSSTESARSPPQRLYKPVWRSICRTAAVRRRLFFLWRSACARIVWCLCVMHAVHYTYELVQCCQLLTVKSS